jgi:5-methylthioadenosine/S-adenosylhomocysteine deaminase
MKVVDLLVAPRWLVPVEPEGQVLEQHALIVHEGRVLDVQPLDFARQLYQPDETLELPDHAVTPGFINAHTHAAMSLMRGLADDLPLMTWLQEHIWPAEGAHVSPAFCEDGVRLACAEFISSGQTCFNDMYFFPQVTAQVARACGLRAAVGLIVMDFPTAYAADAADYLSKALSTHDALRGQPGIYMLFAPHAPYTVSDAPMREIRKYATELGLPIHMHVHETAFEVEDAVARSGQRPLARLDALGLLDPDLSAVHMTQLDDSEIAAVARSGASVVHCPESNLKLASGFCPVAKLIAAGVNVALGTDGAASNNDLDLMGEMRTAALLAKAVANDAAAVPAAKALSMATINGARAIGAGEEIGSLLPGKAADFIAIDLSGIASQPLYDPLSAIVYSANRDQVTHTYVAGKALMRDRQLLTVDSAAVLARAREWRGRIRADIKQLEGDA